MDNTFFLLVFYPLAVWRLTLIVYEERIAKGFRKLMGEQEIAPPITGPLAELAISYTYKNTFTGHLIQCFRCVSVWCAVGMLGAYLIHPYCILPFAASGFAIILRERFNL